MEVFNFLKNRNWELRYEETIQPASTSKSVTCPDFGSSSYADFQDTMPKYQLRSDRLLRNGFKLIFMKVDGQVDSDDRPHSFKKAATRLESVFCIRVFCLKSWA